MSKSILLIDTPENCLKCEFADRRLDGTLRCTRNSDSSNVVFGLSKPDCCPLKEVPEKKENVICQGRGVLGINQLYYSGFTKGWNACIDEISSD